MAMFQEQSSNSGEGTNAGEKAEDVADAAPLSVGDPIALAAAASVLYSWFKFYGQDDESGGIFVGLWAPTLLAAASYLQQKDLVTRLRRGFSSF
ncbi:hypothetical protein ACFQE8_12725 [Salinirubellus sp. GCM10025818]|uniref:hypothetical protein n=1 Tax=Salinirubellus TaxID=2162630 RepID=UPI0030D1BDD2